MAEGTILVLRNGRVTHSDVVTWPITVAGEGAIAKFYNYKTYSGPFKPSTKQKLAKFVVVNSGGSKGIIYFRADQIDENGNVIKNIMNCKTSGSVDPGKGAVFNVNAESDRCGLSMYNAPPDWLWSSRPGWVVNS